MPEGYRQMWAPVALQQNWMISGCISASLSRLVSQPKTPNGSKMRDVYHRLLAMSIISSWLN